MIGEIGALGGGLVPSSMGMARQYIGSYSWGFFLFAALALSLNLLLGYAGQVSVAHAAFGAIGGYAMAYTMQTHGWNFLLGTLLGMVLAAVVPIAFASDTLSIAVMELVDNLIVVLVPGALDAGLGDVLFWGSLSFALVIAGAFALPVNRWLIGRGKGHAVVHQTGIHGGPSPRVVGGVAAVAFVFGAVVLLAEFV